MTAIWPLQLDEVQLAVEHFVSALDPMLLDFISSAGQSIDQTLSGLVMDLSKGALSIITGLAGSLPAFVMNFSSYRHLFFFLHHGLLHHHFLFCTAAAGKRRAAPCLP